MISRVRFLSRAAAGVAAACAAAALAGAVPCAAHTLPAAPPQERPVAITGATIHPVAGPAIPSGVIVFDGGVIRAVGTGVAVPAGALLIDGRGKHVYPGLIAANTRLGLSEIDQARATNDHQETGPLNPNARADVAFNPDSEAIPVARANGVLLAHAVPGGTLLCGLSALMRLDGWTYEELAVQAPAALHLVWPGATIAGLWDTEESRKKAREGRGKRLTELREAFASARAYLRAREAAGAAGVPPHDTDTRWEAMLPVLRGELPLLVTANRAEEIREAVAWAAAEGVRMILLGGAEADQAAAILREQQVPVIVSNVLRVPTRRDMAYDQPYRLPAALRDAGIAFAIAGDGGTSAAAHQRNLPYEAGMAAAFGLTPEEALRAITLSPAVILGVADRLGSLEPGKSATLFLAGGDILEIPTQVERAFIDGREIDLDNRHKQLDRKYREKYRQLGLME